MPYFIGGEREGGVTQKKKSFPSRYSILRLPYFIRLIYTYYPFIYDLISINYYGRFYSSFLYDFNILFFFL